MDSLCFVFLLSCPAASHVKHQCNPCRAWLPQHLFSGAWVAYIVAYRLRLLQWHSSDCFLPNILPMSLFYQLCWRQVSDLTSHGLKLEDVFAEVKQIGFLPNKPQLNCFIHCLLLHLTPASVVIDTPLISGDLCLGATRIRSLSGHIYPEGSTRFLFAWDAFRVFGVGVL